MAGKVRFPDEVVSSYPRPQLQLSNWDMSNQSGRRKPISSNANANSNRAKSNFAPFRFHAHPISRSSDFTLIRFHAHRFYKFGIWVTSYLPPVVASDARNPFWPQDPGPRWSLPRYSLVGHAVLGLIYY